MHRIGRISKELRSVLHVSRVSLLDTTITVFVCVCVCFRKQQ